MPDPIIDQLREVRKIQSGQERDFWRLDHVPGLLELIGTRSSYKTIDTWDISPREGLELRLWIRTVIWVVAKHLPPHNGWVPKQADSLWYVINSNGSSVPVVSVRLWNKSTT